MIEWRHITAIGLNPRGPTVTTAGYRIEYDSMGAVEVPEAALWGAATERAVRNFPPSGLRLPRSFIRALGLIKYCAAGANAELGDLPAPMAAAVQAGANEVAAGMHDDQFPVDLFQTGSGTSTNMNANEVIAALASRRIGVPVHPNDHVNMAQSSNDVIPTRDPRRRRARARRAPPAGASRMSARFSARGCPRFAPSSRPAART